MNFKTAPHEPSANRGFSPRNSVVTSLAKKNLFRLLMAVLAFSIGDVKSVQAQTWNGVGVTGGTGDADFNASANWVGGTATGTFSSITATGSTPTVIRFEGGTVTNLTSLNFNPAGVGTNVQNVTLGDGTLYSGSGAATINLSGNIIVNGNRGSITTIGGVNNSFAGVGSDLILNLGSGGHLFSVPSTGYVGTGNAPVTIVNAQVTGSGSLTAFYTYVNPTTFFSNIVLTNNNSSFTGGVLNQGNLNFTSIGNVGSGSSLGSGGNLQGTNGSQFNYIGSGDQTTNRTYYANLGGTGAATVTVANFATTPSTLTFLNAITASTSVGNSSTSITFLAGAGNTLSLAGGVKGNDGTSVVIGAPGTTGRFLTDGSYVTAANTGIVALGSSSFSGAVKIASGTLSVATVANASTTVATLTTSSGLNTATASNTTGMYVGQVLTTTGTNIPAGTTIIGISGNTITLSNTIATGAVSTVFGGIATANGLGNSTNLASNLVMTNSALQYTGAAASTDRLFTVVGTGTIDASGTGKVNFTNTGSVAYGAANVTRTLSLTGTGSGNLAALISNNGTGATSLIKDGSGVWSLAGNNTYTGSTTIKNGILEINGSLASGATILANTSNAAFLSGTGTVSGSVSVGGGTGISGIDAGMAGMVGTLNTGAVSFGINSQFAFELDSTTAIIDLLKVNGLLSLGGTSLVGTDLGNSSLALGSVLILAEYTSLSGTFNGLGDGANLNIGLNQFQINYGTLDGYANQITLEVVPESSTISLLGLGGILLLLGHVNRKKSCISR